MQRWTLGKGESVKDLRENLLRESAEWPAVPEPFAEAYAPQPV